MRRLKQTVWNSTIKYRMIAAQRCNLLKKHVFEKSIFDSVTSNLAKITLYKGELSNKLCCGHYKRNGMLCTFITVLTKSLLLVKICRQNICVYKCCHTYTQCAIDRIKSAFIMLN